ncbi:MAG: class I SAM-dependent methyltransferase [Pseudomonadota bacterium]
MTTGFSTSWLALREAADHRSRAPQIADAVQARFLTRDSLRIIDLGCGTGANLRGTAHLLPPQQAWTLIDYDPGLLTAARAELTAWADAATDDSGILKLRYGRQQIDVTFRSINLAKDLEDALSAPADLITASAFFDLVSPEFIKAFASSVGAKKAAFLTVLTYNGISQWTPRHPIDQSIIAAFHRHQTTDKGFGTACGPMAAANLADQFRLNDYIVQEGDSPWRLSPRDASLIAELRSGHAAAAKETGLIDKDTTAKWAAIERTSVTIGHTDTFAVPG